MTDAIVRSAAKCALRKTGRKCCPMNFTKYTYTYINIHIPSRAKTRMDQISFPGCRSNLLPPLAFRFEYCKYTEIPTNNENREIKPPETKDNNREGRGGGEGQISTRNNAATSSRHAQFEGSESGKNQKVNRMLENSSRLLCARRCFYFART